MVVAVTYEGGQVFQHFGHSEQMKIYRVEDNKVVSSEVVSTNGSGHGALAGFLVESGADTLICGGIGGGAKNALAEAGITLYPGVSGAADTAVEDLLAGKLELNPDTECAHHNETHGEGHTCGDHGCGGHDHEDGGCGSHGCGSHGCGGHQMPELDYEFSNPEGGVRVVTTESFNDEVMNHGYICVVDFWADWCQPCKMLSPIVDELSKEMTDVKFCKVNVDEQQALASHFGVESIPTLAVVKANTIIDFIVGFQPKEQLREAIEKAKYIM